MPFVLSAVDRALAQATPHIFNSDQGSHFTSPQYLQRLEAAHVQISRDGKHRAFDNIFTERLWRSVKYEEVYLHDYAHPRAARQGLGGYFEFYNHERPHQALDYRTPAQVYYARRYPTPNPELWGGGYVDTWNSAVAHIPTATTTTATTLSLPDPILQGVKSTLKSASFVS